MPRQIAAGLPEPSTALLEERIRRLEVSVALLTHAVQALARELTGGRDHERDEAVTRPPATAVTRPYSRRQRASQKE